MALDDDLVEDMINSGVKPNTDRPSLADWSLEASYLAAVIDQIANLTATVAAIAGGKPGEPRPVPRPLTARERVEMRQSMERHISLVSEVAEAQARWAHLNS